MEPQHTSVNYGVYIDHSQSFIITLYNSSDREPVIENVTETADDETGNYYAIQHKGKEYVRKLCRSIVNRLGHAQSLLIFGPAEAKYTLRNELQSAGTILLAEREHLVTTDLMSVEEALRFSRRHVRQEPQTAN